MIKMLLSGAWGACVALVCAQVAMTWGAPSGAAAPERPQPTPVKLSPLSVPIIADGKIQGYIVARLSFSADGARGKTAPAALDAFLSDEAFRTIYSDESIDFRSLKKHDLAAFAEKVVERVNARLGGPVVLNGFVDEFNYVPIEEARRGPPRGETKPPR
ncbi:MAG: hypothetical protein NW215_14945 [Hyphomicrobiales bacterium]|nr:hypothetical protein [Hyphomicrobiales bacterium]